MKTTKAILCLMIVGALAMQSCKKGAEDPGLSMSSRKSRISGVWTVKSFDRTTSYKDVFQANDPNDDYEVLSREGVTSETYDGTAITYDESYDVTNETSTSNYSWNITASGTTYSESNTYHNGSTQVTTTKTGTYGAAHSEIWDIKKDGTFTRTLVSTRSYSYTDKSDPDLDEISSFEMSENTTYSGTWSFMGGNASEDYKNKQRVGFWITSKSGTETTVDIDQIIDNKASLFSDISSKDESENVTTLNETIENMEPDMVWDLVMLKGKEMKVQFSSSMEDNSSSKETNVHTDTNGSTTNSNTSVVNHTESSEGNMTFAQ